MDAVTLKLGWTIHEHIVSVTCSKCGNFFWIPQSIVTPDGNHPIHYCAFCGAKRGE